MNTDAIAEMVLKARYGNPDELFDNLDAMRELTSQVSKDVGDSNPSLGFCLSILADLIAINEVQMRLQYDPEFSTETTINAPTSNHHDRHARQRDD